MNGDAAGAWWRCDAAHGKVTLTLHVQDGEIIKATSPLNNDITVGNLCIKGRFGSSFVNEKPGR